MNSGLSDEKHPDPKLVDLKDWIGDGIASKESVTKESVTKERLPALAARIQTFSPDNIGLLDVRTLQEFEQYHFKNFAHIQANDIFERVQELPIKAVSLLLLGTTPQIKIVSEFLSQRGYQIKECWITDGLTEKHWDILLNNQMAVQGEQTHFLWQPNQFLVNQIEAIEQIFPNKGKVLDIACGSGREATFLAQRGWQVTAIDNQMEAIGRCQNIARYNQVKINSFCLDIIQNPQQLSSDSFDLIIMFRFLHRPLFSHIQKWLKKDGFFVCETFSIEAAKFGKPRRRSLLLIPGELEQAFSNWTCSPEKSRLLTDGRPLIGFQAQK